VIILGSAEFLSKTKIEKYDFMTNRRQFLSGCSTLALAATFAPTALPAASLFSRNAGPDQLTFATFSRCLGSAFVVRRADAPSVALEMTQARRQPVSSLDAADAPDAHHEKFSLLFRGPQSAALTQNTYAFEHSHIGRFEMFIVPVGVKDESHVCYEAIFNRAVGGPVGA
jgi:hypothetical protein